MAAFVIFYPHFVNVLIYSTIGVTFSFRTSTRGES
jgi:hypothetical protein